MRILGVSLGTIILVVAVAFFVRKWGDMVPVLNKVGASAA